MISSLPAGSKPSLFAQITQSYTLKGKSGVGITIDYARDYTVVNAVQYVSQFFSLLSCETTYFNLLRSAK